MDLTIVHHLGIGDSLNINGMVRHFSSKGYHVHVITRKKQYESIQFMYRDDSNIIVLTTESDNPNDIRSVIKGTSLNLGTYSCSNNEWAYIIKNFNSWAHFPYYQAGLNPIIMKTKFKLVRDTEREEELLKTFGDDDFIFVHEDPKHKCLQVDTTYNIIKPDTVSLPFNIFDWLGVLEKAKEIHCGHGGFAWIVEMCNIGTKETNFFHLNCANPTISTKEVMCVFSEDQWTFKNE